MKRTGQCLCGAVKFTGTCETTEHSACHCGMCRRWCGGAPLFSVLCKDVRFEGEANITRHTSSSWAERGFCKTCGSTLFYLYKPKDAYFMAVGALDDAAEYRLAEEIFIDEKPAGYTFTGDHPRLTKAECMAKHAANQPA